MTAERTPMTTADQPLIDTPVEPETLATPAMGLEPRDQPAKRVIVIGGGIAGLVCAFELVRQGHEPLVLEAQHRVGGRVRTIHDFAPGLYAEAGAMRIPRVHDLTLAYCDLFGLELRPFVMGNPKTLVYIDGKRMTVAEADAHRRIHFAGEHTSLYHAWIQGALESGIRAAKEIHEAPPVFAGAAES